MESIHTKPQRELYWEDKCMRIHCLLAQKHRTNKWDFISARKTLNDMVIEAANDKELNIALDNIEIFDCIFDCINWDDEADLTKKLF